MTTNSIDSHYIIAQCNVKPHALKPAEILEYFNSASNDFYNNKRMSDESSWVNEVGKHRESASKRLQAYIKQYDVEWTPQGTPSSGCYASSTVSSLLSSKPKAALGKPAHLSKEGMTNNLVEWVNASYAKDLQRKVVPYGSGSTSSIPSKLRLSEIEDDDNDDEDTRSVWSDPGVSTLPSPGSSVALDLDSNVGSVSTDKLLNSFYKKQNNKQASRNYPSWVEHISQEDYPSWLDDIDKTQLTHNERSNVIHENSSRNRLSRSLSPTVFRRHPTFSTGHNKFPAKSRAVKNEAWELESVDTEVLLSQPIYGNQPVNMGGTLHTKLYKDKKIEKLCEQSFRKVGKKPQKESTPISGTFTKSSKKDEKRLFSVANNNTTPYSTSTNYRRRYPSYPRDSGSPPKTHEHRLEVKISAPIHKPLRAMSNLKLSLQDRKQSVDSNNTDKLMRLSPTGIRMDSRSFRTSTSSPKSTSKTPRERSKNDSPASRKQASEKLTRFIESNSVKNENWTKQRAHVKREPILRDMSTAKFHHNPRNETPGNYHTSADHYRRKSPTGMSPQTLFPSAHGAARSVPHLRVVTVPGSDVLANRLRHLTLTDRRRSPRGFTSNTRRHEDTNSVNTEKLVVYPPMPLFDASPSLTTVSESSAGSTESGDTLVEQEALKTSFLFEETGQRAGITPSSRADVIETPRDWYQNRNYSSRTQISEKPGIITSFLEDCLRSSQESDMGTSVTEERASPTISNDSSERPVETLKKLLFTVQNLTKSSEEDNPGDGTRSENANSCTESDRFTGNESGEILSDVNSDDKTEENDSLSRAYYHLSRLKRLVSVSQQVAASK